MFTTYQRILKTRPYTLRSDQERVLYDRIQVLKEHGEKMRFLPQQVSNKFYADKKLVYNL